MPVKIGSKIKVAIDIDGEDVVATFPPHTDPAMIRGIRKMKLAALGSGRRGTNMRKVAQNLERARVEFFDTLCTEIENVLVEQDGEDTPLTSATENWKSYIPEVWKTSFARYFDEREVISPDDAGN